MNNAKIALITSKILTESVSNTLSALRQSFKFDFDIYEYKEFGELPELFSQISQKYDGFLTTGMFVSLAIVTILGEQEKPIVAIDLDELSIYKSMLNLLYTNRNLDFDRVAADLFAALDEEKPTLSRFLKPDWNQIYNEIKIQPYVNNSREFLNWVYNLEDIVLRRLIKLYNNNEIDYVICRFGSIVPDLEERDIPCEFNFPSAKYISEMLQELINAIELHKIRENLPAAIYISLKQAGNLDNESLSVAMVSVKKCLFDYSRNAGTGFLTQPESDGFRVITDSGFVHKATNAFTVCGIKNYMDEHCPFEVFVGYGIGSTPSKSSQRARRAVIEASYKNKSYLVNENDHLIGPMDSVNLISIDSNITPEIQRAAEISKLSTLTIKKINTLLNSMSTNMITTLDLSHNLSMSVRNANRILKKMEQSGIAQVVRKESNQSKGRPVLVYKIDL